jgi:membrane-bound lytic murein transglycosylase A
LPVYIKTQNPITQEKINQLMIAADTGGAIKGKIRADFYWGFGDDAAQIAGKMKELGKLFVLLPKEVMQ